jgi:hypothetical protein
MKREALPRQDIAAPSSCSSCINGGSKKQAPLLQKFQIRQPDRLSSCVQEEGEALSEPEAQLN